MVNWLNFSAILLFYGAYSYLHHEFPTVDGHGKKITNEFQLIHPENIVTNQQSGKLYQILDITPILIANDGIVTVNYATSSPGYYDWIGIYSPSYVDITTTVPVKYGWCDESKGYNSTGRGSLQFNMTNLRADFTAYYFVNGTEYPAKVNSTNINVTFADNNQPLRPRVVATGDLDSYDLLWSSSSSTAPELRWGISTGNYSRTVVATTSSIPQTSMCGAPASTIGWRDLGLIHTAAFSGMTTLANSKLYYIFGDASTNDFSLEHVFFVPPLPGTQPPDRATTVILYDDLGRGSTDDTYTWDEYGRPSIYTTMAVGAEVSAGEIDAVYHGGDISYATGYAAVWDFFLDQLAPVAGSVLYFTTVGNHETDWPNSPSLFNTTDSGGECGVMSTQLIPMPAPATTDKPWWSYDVGLMHMVGMSTEHNFTVGSEQYLWLENDLKSVNRTITPWIIFGGHRAMYVNSDYGGAFSSDISVMDQLILNIEPLLWKYRVNLAFYGHDHVVQRQAAVFNKTVVQHSVKITEANGDVVYMHANPQATVHMVVGTGGAAFTYNAVYPPPDWNEYTFHHWGYARVTAVNASVLDWKWINAYNSAVIDHMVITQDLASSSSSWVLPVAAAGGGDGGSQPAAVLSTGAIAAILAVAVALILGSVGYVCLKTKATWMKLGGKEADNKSMSGSGSGSGEGVAMVDHPAVISPHHHSHLGGAVEVQRLTSQDDSNI